MPLALKGTIVRLSKARPKETITGTIYFNDTGLVAAVKKSGEAAPTGFASATVVDVGDSFIYPGLIDLHSHLGYNTLPLWTEPNEPRPFLHHDIWPGRSTYEPKISWPAWVLVNAAPEALLVYVQVRALAGGTTGIQGWPSANRRPANQLVRNVDDQKFSDEHAGKDNVMTSALTLDDDDLADRAQFIERGGGFIYHCAEGQIDSRVVREFEDLGATNCLRERLIAIHCSAIGGPEFKKWKDRAEIAGDDGPGSLVWSPFSNLWLYAQTTNIPAAKEHGIRICLGSDWGPSGTKNLLGEMKVARLWIEHEGWDFDAFDLVEMVTATPGDALSQCWGKQVGRLVAGALGDVTVVSRTTDDPWENLVQAREEQVDLVLIDGRPRYGTKDLMDACGAERTTSLEVGSERRRIALVNPEDKDKPPDQQRSWTWNEVLERLEAVRDDPIGAIEAANAPNAAAGRIPAAAGPDNDPLVLELDMPGGPRAFAGPPPEGVVVDIPELSSLRHDKPWRTTIKNAGFHGGVLDDLDQFYV